MAELIFTHGTPKYGKIIRSPENTQKQRIELLHIPPVLTLNYTHSDKSEVAN